jgi:hypothetical protein
VEPIPLELGNYNKKGFRLLKEKMLQGSGLLTVVCIIQAFLGINLAASTKLTPCVLHAEKLPSSMMT